MTRELIDSYDPNAPLEQAATIPSSWYTDHRIYDLELQSVFARSWQMIGLAERVAEPGQYLTCEISGEPIVVVRGNDNVLRAFYNVFVPIMAGPIRWQAS